jgi:hypothetical protein
MSYIKEVFGFSGQVAILCSIVAAIICLVVIPQDIRQKIFLHIHISRRTIKFVIRAKLDNNREFIIQTHKRNEQKINRYFEGKYDKLYLKIVDFRKYSIIKNIIFNKEIRRQKILKPALKKINNQHLLCDKAMVCLLSDKSIINSEVYRKKYVYNDLIMSIVKYCVHDRNNQVDKFKVKFFYLKTKQNNLPHDIELKIEIDENFLEKYSKKIDELYFDKSKINKYMIEYGVEDWDKDLAYDFIDFEKRNNMDIYDLEIEDYIKYIAPPFYSFISIIRDGEWVYSNLDIKQYRIDHFLFDLKALYKLCKEKKLV